MLAAIGKPGFQLCDFQFQLFGTFIDKTGDTFLFK